jgi:hypothetical protein
MKTGGTQLGRIAPDLAALRDSWRQRSLDSGWLAADDWHTPAVDAVARAVVSPSEPDLLRACGRLGQARGRAGIGIAETITDLAALYQALDRGEPPVRLISSAAEGWAEQGLAQLAGGSCEDPLTGLTTVAYLRTRLSEVYREAAELGTSAARSHRLVVVSPPRRADPWRRLASSIVLGNDLRTAFPGGDTLSQVPGPGTGIALVRADDAMPARYAKLRRALGSRGGTRITMTQMPALLPEALLLVDRLAF